MILGVQELPPDIRPYRVLVFAGQTSKADFLKLAQGNGLFTFGIKAGVQLHVHGIVPCPEKRDLRPGYYR